MAGIVAETVLLRDEPLPVYGTSTYERGWQELPAEQRSDVELIAGGTGYTDPMPCFYDRVVTSAGSLASDILWINSKVVHTLSTHLRNVGDIDDDEIHQFFVNNPVAMPTSKPLVGGPRGRECRADDSQPVDSPRR